MHQHIRRAACAVAAIVALGGPALAETTVNLEMMRQTLVTDASGAQTPRLEAITSALPGEQVIFRVTLTNTADSDATTIGMTLPINPNISIDPTSMPATALVTYSTDGGETFRPFEELSVIDNGAARSAMPEDLTHVSLGVAQLSGRETIVLEFSGRVR